MFDSILVPVDLTEKNRHAMDAAATLARGRDAAKLTLLHVIASIEHVPYEELADFYATLEQRAGEALEGWRQELADQG
ncbi:MAG TPA: universal stress protein, partial [Thermoanaerobaculia bacterium]|nr:universal stress protein [Thermoanaerobaculia bacterium]